MGEGKGLDAKGIKYNQSPPQIASKVERRSQQHCTREQRRGGRGIETKLLLLIVLIYWSPPHKDALARASSLLGKFMDSPWAFCHVQVGLRRPLSNYSLPSSLWRAFVQSTKALLSPYNVDDHTTSSVGVISQDYKLSVYNLGAHRHSQKGGM
jgi:hypothetical protein